MVLMFTTLSLTFSMISRMAFSSYDKGWFLKNGLSAFLIKLERFSLVVVAGVHALRG